jgi:hypothetical protein
VQCNVITDREYVNDEVILCFDRIERRGHGRTKYQSTESDPRLVGRRQ